MICPRCKNNRIKEGDEYCLFCKKRINMEFKASIIEGINNTNYQTENLIFNSGMPTTELEQKLDLEKDSCDSQIDINEKSSFMIKNIYEERIQIESKRLKELFQIVLKGKSHNSMEKLAAELKISLYKNLNGKGSSMSLESFNRLQNLLDFDLEIETDYNIKEPLVSKINITKSKELANLIGILLGDGGVNEKRRKIAIFLNRNEDSDIVSHTKEIIKLIFNYDTYDYINGKVIALTIFSLAIVNALMNVGIVSGNKVINQVKIPEWIFEKREYIIECLKGLLDTDGSIYVCKKSKHFRISFGSASKPLVSGFKKLCELIKINSSRPIEAENKSEIAWITQITKLEDVVNFLNTINPIKWNDTTRRSYWGYQLIYINSNSSIIDAIENEIEIFKIHKETKVFSYTLENFRFLEQLMNKYFTTTQLIFQKREDAIKKGLSYKISHYSKSTGLKYFRFLEKYGSYPAIKSIMIKKNIAIIPEPHTLYKYIKKFFNETEIINQYGEDAYDKWFNFNIEINIQNKKVFRCSLPIRQEICSEIFHLIYDKNYLNFITSEYIKLHNVKPSSIFSLLEFIIKNKDLNENFCFPASEIKILKFGRFSELLNNNYENPILERYIYNHINFIIVVFNYFKEKKKIVFKHLKNESNINWENNVINNIIKYIENSSNIQFL